MTPKDETELLPFKMVKHSKGFLSEENIEHDSEIFQYIRELHDLLWKIVGHTRIDLKDAIEAYMNTRPTKNVDELVEALEKALVIAEQFEEMYGSETSNSMTKQFYDDRDFIKQALRNWRK